MNPRRRAVLGLAALLLLPLGAANAPAQDYPARPVTLVVPYAAGGGLDVLGRQLAQKLSERLGKPFVVENRTGAGTVIGANSVAKAAPDGYTIMLGTSTPFAIVARVNKNSAVRSRPRLRADHHVLERALHAAGAPLAAGAFAARADRAGEIAARPLLLRLRRTRFAAAPQHGAAQEYDRDRRGARAIPRRRRLAARPRGRPRGDDVRRAHPGAAAPARRPGARARSVVANAPGRRCPTCRRWRRPACRASTSCRGR